MRIGYKKVRNVLEARLTSGIIDFEVSGELLETLERILKLEESHGIGKVYFHLSLLKGFFGTLFKNFNG
jgi:hypothetical protein